MGVDYRGGAVYGYRVKYDDLQDRYGEDADCVWDAEQEFGVNVAMEGNFYSAEQPDVVFYVTGARVELRGRYGYVSVDDLNTDAEQLRPVMVAFEGSLGLHAFLTVC